MARELIKNLLNTSMKKIKTRMHRVLFDSNLPFKPQVVPLKTQYKRKPKHRSADE